MQWENRKNAEYYDWKLKKLTLPRFEALKHKAYRTENLKVGGLTEKEKQAIIDKYKSLT